MRLVQTTIALASLLFAAVSWAEDGGWRIVQATGVVKAGASGFTPAAVSPNATLEKDSWVETGDTGRVVLVRGLETIAVGPNSRLQLPSQPVNGNTQVLQTLGSALYQIGKQKKPHFQVDTPYLAAVVKGTTFTVSVGEGASAVEVTEGLVEVATPDGSDTEYVSPGFTGVVSKNNPGNVTVETTKHDPAAPGGTSTTPGDKSASNASNNGRTVIAMAIGETVIDVKEVSGGLANGADNAVANGNGLKVGLVARGEASADETGSSKGNSSSSNGISASVVSVELGNGNGNGNAGGNGNGASVAASVEIDTGNGNGLALGVGNGNGNGGAVGASVDLGSGGAVTVEVAGNAGGSGGGLSLGLGNGGAGGNGGGLALGLGNGGAGGNGGGLGLGLGGGNGNN